MAGRALSAVRSRHTTGGLVDPRWCVDSVGPTARLLHGDGEHVELLALTDQRPACGDAATR
jgi:hypothetical protein